MDAAAIIRKKFLPWYQAHGFNHRALGYGSNRSQEIRFLQFVRAFDLNGHSLLDVGCGFGDLYAFLQRNGIGLTGYTGLDLLPEFISVAREKNTDDRCRFLAKDFLAEPINDELRSDFVLATAALNTGVPDRDSFVKSFLRRMWDLCEIGIGFDMENVHGFKEKKPEINLDPAYWLDFVSRDLTHKVVLFSDYHDANFTICAWKR